MAGADLVVVNSGKMRNLHRALRDIDKKQASALTRRLRKIAVPLAEDVKKAAMSTPSTASYTEDDLAYARKHGMHRLRAGIAAAVEVRVSAKANGGNARIRVSGTKFARATGKYKKLPRYLEGLGRRPWRHPVFAKKGSTRGTWKGAWVEQKAHPYLLPTVLPRKNEIREQLINEYQETFKKHLQAHGIPVR